MVVGYEVFYSTLGKRISQIRSQRGLTQEQLGSRLDPPLTRASIANIEQGRQRILAHTMFQLANSLGITIEDLMPGSSSDDLKMVAAELKRKLPEKTAKSIVEVLIAEGSKEGGEYGKTSRTKSSRTIGRAVGHQGDSRRH